MGVMDAIEAVGYALDTPGAYTRGVLGGRPGKRLSGREMLTNWGATAPNDESKWEWSDLAGGAAEMLADPMNLLGVGWLGKVGAANKAIRAGNKSSQALRAAGAMPEEVAALTAIKDPATGMPAKWYHGTGASVDRVTDLDPQRTGAATDEGWYGKGTYFAGPHEPETASDYALAYGQTGSPRVLSGFLDVRRPFVYRGPKPLRREFDDALPPGVMRAVEHDVDGLDGYYDLWGKVRASSLTRHLKKAGHDGVVIETDGIPVEGLAFDAEQIYAPYIAPRLKPEQSYAPIATYLGGYNALVGPQRGQKR